MQQTAQATRERGAFQQSRPASDQPIAARASLVHKFAKHHEIDPDKVLPILKATAFKQSNGRECTNEQLAALLVICNEYDLNPWTKEIYALDDKRGGIIPVVSVDGWGRIINDHPQFDGVEFEYGPEVPADPKTKRNVITYEWVDCLIYRKDRSRPIRVREYLDECYQPPRGEKQTPGPWQSHPKRFLRHKALIQCARVAFSFSGVYDDDEATRIIDGEIVRSETIVQRGPADVAGAGDLNAMAGVQQAAEVVDGEAVTVTEDEIEAERESTQRDDDEPPFDADRDYSADPIPGLD